MPQLRIASINIERSKHLPRVEKFLKWYQPDVLCLQELCARDIPYFEDFLGNRLVYAPMCRHAAEVEMETIGIAIGAWSNMSDESAAYYHGSPDNIQDIRFITYENGYRCADNESVANVLLSVTCQGFRIATTHLNVTIKGEAAPYQLASAGKLVKIAETESQKTGGLLIAGDFNAPRGNATFDLIASRFTDGIPAHYTTSLDPSLHKAGPVPFMVDGLFHTPNYTITDATLHNGVSDHCAVTATVSRP